MADTAEVFEKLFAKFQTDVGEIISIDGPSRRISESGKPRLAIRSVISSLRSVAEAQLEIDVQVKLVLSFASDLYEYQEYDLAIECFEWALNKCDLIGNKLTSVKKRAESIQNLVQSNYTVLSSLHQTYITPMSVSRLLVCLKQLRSGLESIFELTIKEQEDLAWQVLNICKLILEIGQPLIWYSCGRYVIETMMFAALSMEAVINLCTVRHMKFRMKLYASVFYATLTQSSIDEAIIVFEHTKQQITELQEREELDPPVPKASLVCLHQNKIDLAVMGNVLNFWRDPDGLDLTDAALNKIFDTTQNKELVSNLQLRSLRDLVVCECIRVHLLTSGNTNEPFRKRSSCILKAVNKVLSGYVVIPDDSKEPSAEASQEEKGGDGKEETTAATKPDNSQYFEMFSLQALLEIAMISMFETVEGVDVAAFLAVVFSLAREVNNKTLTNTNTDVDTYNIKTMNNDHDITSAKTVNQTAVNSYVNIANCAFELDILSKLCKLIDMDEGSARTVYTATLINQIHQFQHDDTQSYRRKAVLRKVVIALWAKFVYPLLQTLLSAPQAANTNTDSVSKTKATSKTTRTTKTVKTNSTTDDNTTTLRDEIRPVLVEVLQILDLTVLEDPVLVASIALIAGNVLFEVNDERGAIGILRNALELVQQHRDARVDMALHMPDDPRDLKALQHAAFTTRAGANDWFHSMKRLGAHAFAGYGIFGLNSSADRSDQALADLQTDLVALYFRCELTHAISQKIKKHRIRQKFAKIRAAAEAHLVPIPPNSPTKLKSKILNTKIDPKKQTATLTKTKNNAKTLTTGTVDANNAVSVKFEGLASANNVNGSPINFSGTSTAANHVATSTSDAVDVTKLPIVVSLRSYCAKNSYYRALLLMEMAKLDKSGGTGQLDENGIEIYDFTPRSVLLQEAFDAIVESEGRELSLKQAFDELLVMTDSERRPPLVLARNHHYVYICPIGCRALAKAAYYRIFAKERGSGTDVSLHNEDLGGCERKVLVQELQSPKSCFVKIGPLRPGEQYLFGCAAFTANDKAIGTISPSTVVVDAVNPLPTIALWSLLQQAAAELLPFGVSNVIGIEAARRVCSRYFVDSKEQQIITVGKGLNVFMTKEPNLCMLAVQQSSPHLLMLFIRAVLNYIRLQFKHTKTNGHINWRLRKSQQLEFIDALQRVSFVLPIACGVKNHELIIQCCLLGYDIIKEVVQYDLQHLAKYIQSPLLTIVTAMQQTLKRDWLVLEHQLYCKLLSDLVMVGCANRNVTSVIRLLNQFYPEHQEVIPPVVAVESYYYLWQNVKRCIASTHLTAATAQFARVLAEHAFTDVASNAGSAAAAATAEQSDVGPFWKLTTSQRLNTITPDVAKAIATNTAETQLRTWLQQKPYAMSDYIITFGHSLKQMLHTNNAIITTDNIKSLLTQFTICAEYMPDRFKREHTVCWGLVFLQSMEQILSKTTTISPREETAKPAKALKGAAAETAATEAAAKAEAAKLALEQASKIPDRFLNISRDEENLQLQALGNVCYYLYELHTLVMTKCTAVVEVNYYPTSTAGPNLVLDPTTFTQVSNVADTIETNDQEEVLPAVDAQPVQQSPTASTTLPLSKLDSVRYLAAAVDLFAKSEITPLATVQAAHKLWNFIVQEWFDPLAFAHEFKSLQAGLQSTLASLCQLLESIGYAEVVADVFAFEEDDDGMAQLATGIMKVSFSESVGMFRTVDDVDNNKAAVVATFNEREVKECMLQLRDLLIFLIKVLWVLQQYEDVVTVATKTSNLYMANTPEFGKYLADALYPFIVDAQTKLVSQARAAMETKQQDLSTFIANYEEAQSKKRKKKARIARLEKDEDELAFEAERDSLQDRVDEAEGVLQENERRLNIVQAMEADLSACVSHGTVLLDAVRKKSNALVTHILTQFGSDVDFPKALLHLTAANTIATGSNTSQTSTQSSIPKQFEAIVNQYNHVCNYLRIKKEIPLLLAALKEQGDLLLLFNKVAEARTVWHDAIDGLFSRMEACQNWREVCDDVLSKPVDTELVTNVFPAVAVLGKLSKFTAPGDWDAKAGYCRMAAELCRLPFQESVGHPLTLVGFGAYWCADLGGVLSLSNHDGYLGSKSLCIALTEVVTVLMYEEQFLPALPVVVLLEYFTAYYLRHAEMWLQARLFRVRLLVQLHLFSEAAAMLASIEPTIQKIVTHQLAQPLRSTTASETIDLSTFETSVNALDFYGRAVFYNNVAPHTADNSKALQWIQTFASEFNTFAKSFIVKLPPPVYTEEELEARAQARKEAEAAAIAAAEAAAKKNKGKAPQPAAPTPTLDDDVNPTRAMFSAAIKCDVALTCAAFLLEIARLDESITAAHSVALKEHGTAGVALVQEVLQIVQQEHASAIATDAVWLSIYGRCQVLEQQYLIHQRKYRNARASVTNFLLLLHSDQFVSTTSTISTSSSVHASVEVADLNNAEQELLASTRIEKHSFVGNMLSVLAQLWFHAKYLLLVVCARQSRLQHVLNVSSNSVKEASVTLNGFWVRRFLLLRADAHFKLGNNREAMHDCNLVLQQLAQHYVENTLTVKVLCLKASILREIATYATRSDAKTNFIECVVVLEHAKSIAEQLLIKHGGVDADTNALIASSNTVVKQHHALNPVLFDLTTTNNNELLLTTCPELNAKYLLNRANILINGNSTATNVVESVMTTDFNSDEVLTHLRLGVVDDDETTTSPCVTVNVYLAESRCLVTTLVALTEVLEDVRNSGACSHLIRTSTSANAEMLAEFNPTALLNKQVFYSESVLKLFRQTVYTPSTMRVHALLIAGKARIAKGNKLVEKEPDMSRLLLAPLTTALSIGVNSNTYPWLLLRQLSLQLLVLLGDPAINFGENMDPAVKLKSAVFYLVQAITFTNQYNTITQNVTTLLHNDGSGIFNTPLSIELLQLVENTSASSVTASLKDQQQQNTADTTSNTAAAPAKGGKGSKASATATTTTATTIATTTPTARDAIFLLSSVLREVNPLWLDSYELAIAADIHTLLKATYTSYASACTSAIETVQCNEQTLASLVVPVATISTLWEPLQAPLGYHTLVTDEKTAMVEDSQHCGLYSHLSVFFLLGNVKKGDGNTATTATAPPVAAKKGGKNAVDPSTTANNTSMASESPVITKLELHRNDVMFVEKKLRDLRDRFINATNKQQITVLQQCCQEYGQLCCLIVTLLKTGMLSTALTASDGVNSQAWIELPTKKKTKMTTTATDNSSRDILYNDAITAAKSTYEVAVKSDGTNTFGLLLTVENKKKPVQIDTITEQLLLQTANVFSNNISLLMEANNDLCAIVRYALGHSD